MNLEDELRALGRSTEVPPVAPSLEAAVLARVAQLPVRRRLRDRWRAFVAGLCVVLAGVALTPPVRATVAEWLRIGGVEARPIGTPPPTAPPVPTASDQPSEVGAAGFVPRYPRGLGPPDAVDASPGFIAMSWGGMRLEQFRSGISPMYLKQNYKKLEYIRQVDGYWFSTPHELVLVNEHVVRIAGPTLVWESDEARRCTRYMIRRTLALVAALFIATATPAAAGGPTYVLLSNLPQVVAFTSTDPQYVRLAELTVVRDARQGERHEIGRRINVAWLRYGMESWRVDYIYPEAPGGPWISTSEAKDGSTNLLPPVWHRGTDPAALKKLLDALPLEPEQPATVAQAAPEAEPGAFTWWRWGVAGAVLGFALAIPLKLFAGRAGSRHGRWWWGRCES